MTQEIPYFEDKVFPVQADKETVERNMIQAVVWDKTSNTVMLLKWLEHDWKTLVLGGVEGDEDMVTAAKREIAEETGYTDITFLGEVGKSTASFYAAHKGVNRLAHNTGLLFELNSDERQEVDVKESAQHEYHWVPVEEARDFLNIDAQQYMWDKAREKMGI
jgi:8-oxo-dGTP pyrophosphatase MutT (NUDIX family)